MILWRLRGVTEREVVRDIEKHPGAIASSSNAATS
jgi:hypothetical protein